jgi:hypothetical protein
MAVARKSLDFLDLSEFWASTSSLSISIRARGKPRPGDSLSRQSPLADEKEKPKSRRFTRSPLVGLSLPRMDRRKPASNCSSFRCYISETKSNFLAAALTLTVNFVDMVLLISVGFIVPYRVIRAMVVGIR